MINIFNIRMNLKPINNYEGHYSFDLNNNQVYSHKSNKYLKPQLTKGYYMFQFSKNSQFKNIYLHRLVYEAFNGTIPEGLLIDHIDNNPLNNDICNLRLATSSENQYNKKVSKNNKIGYKNISYSEKRKDFCVRIRKNKKLIVNKYFKNLEEAIEYRNIQLKLIHSEFYNLG